MIIRIMRHGDAPTIDGIRQLSANGYAEVERMGAWLSRQEPIDQIIASPLLRAEQTYQTVAACLEYNYTFSEEALLKPEADPRIASSYFESLDVGSLLLISHMPLVSNLLNEWLPNDHRYFPTAAIAEIQLTLGKAVLKGFVSPESEQIG